MDDKVPSLPEADEPCGRYDSVDKKIESEVLEVDPLVPTRQEESDEGPEADKKPV